VYVVRLIQAKMSRMDSMKLVEKVLDAKIASPRIASNPD
jgi:hypothetical protein